METFVLDNLRDLLPLSHGDIRRFHVAGNYRRVKFELVSSGAVEVFAALPLDDDRTRLGVDPETGELVATSTEARPFQRLIACLPAGGSARVEFAVNGVSFVDVAFSLAEGCELSMRSFDGSQTVERSDSPAFTTLEPPSGGSTEFDRMMMIARLNMAQLQETQRQASEAARADREAAAALLAQAQAAPALEAPADA